MIGQLTKNSFWKHNQTGNTYQVLMVTNRHTTNENFPLTVVYRNANMITNEWSQSAKRFLATMTPVNPVEKE